MAKTATCGFCGLPAVTKEHVWPDWLRRLILESRTEVGQKSFTMEVERGKKTTRFSSRALEATVHMPCARCNNGWMSALEGTVKPFMAEMVFPGVKTILDVERQGALARWAVKTAMVFEFVGKAPVPYFTPEERFGFKTLAQIPENTWIWIGRYDATQPAHSLQHRIGQRRQDGTVTPAYSFTFTADFLALQVFSFRGAPPSDSRMPVNPGPWKQALLRIWPTSAVDVSWPPDLEIDHDHLGEFDSRFITANE